MEQGWVSSAVVVPFALATTVWGVWATYVAFVGGTIPLLGWEVTGSAGTGFLWLLIIVPIFETIAYWAAMLVAVPLEVLFGGRSRD